MTSKLIYYMCLIVILAVLGVISAKAAVCFLSGMFIGAFILAREANGLIANKDKTIHEQNEVIRRMEYDLERAKGATSLWEYKVRHFYNKFIPENIKEHRTAP